MVGLLVGLEYPLVGPCHVYRDRDYTSTGGGGYELTMTTVSRCAPEIAIEDIFQHFYGPLEQALMDVR